MTSIDVTIHDLASHLCAVRAPEARRHAIFVEMLGSLRKLIEGDTMLRVTKQQSDEARRKIAELQAKM